ncbi:hypothetical protein [Bradyrhizobium sp. ORS 285]|uniref:hypothetical protein n=1 Tax=Bradyrhizobium sp. ORS 285 TaxID=115808 RepID=UPI000682A170|nr:hypothetical protein [Bradyrhizobium sp. ORS 285]
MLIRLGAAALAVLSCLSWSPVDAQPAAQWSDLRSEFVRQCAPHMIGRWGHPEAVCSCLHDQAAAVVEDVDLREALLRGIRETGVPTIETAWVPPAKRGEIGPTFTRIAKPALQCLFDPPADHQTADVPQN